MASLIRQHTQSLRQSSGSSDEGTGNDIRQPTHSIEAKRWGHSPGQTLRTAPFAKQPAGVAASTTRKALVTKFAQAALTPTAKAGVPAAQRRAIAVLRERRLQALEEKDASRRGGESGATDASED
ncbi:hypothetical protein HaLaN_02606, partial [Haematococcus lacustris]